MQHRALAATAVLALALLPVKGRGQDFQDRAQPVLLNHLSQQSAAAPAASTPEEGWKALDTAWNGGVPARPPVAASDGALPRPAFSPSRAPSVGFAAAPASESIAERRKKLQAQRVPGKAVNAVAGAALGFAAGVAAGWLIGAVGAAAFVLKAPNPAVHNLRWVLLLPAVALGAVIGELALPFVLGYVFSKAEPYPTKGIPEDQHHA